MGYNTQITRSTVKISLDADTQAKAYEALVELNNQNHLKSGGRYPKPEGLPEDQPNEFVWFSWMDWNYHESCKSVKSVLSTLGFGVYLEDNFLTVEDYDSKSGDENHFFEVLAPYIESGGFINWEGEDGCLYRWEFREGQMFQLSGTVVWE